MKLRIKPRLLMCRVWVARQLRNFKNPLNLRDTHIYGGLAIASAGGWQVSPAWTGIALGLTLFLLGILAPRLARKE